MINPLYNIWDVTFPEIKEEKEINKGLFTGIISIYKTLGNSFPLYWGWAGVYQHLQAEKLINHSDEELEALRILASNEVCKNIEKIINPVTYHKQKEKFAQGRMNDEIENEKIKIIVQEYVKRINQEEKKES